MTPRDRSCLAVLLGLAVLIGLHLASPAGAITTIDKCTAAKLTALAKKEKGLLTCHAKVAAKGDATLLALCVQKVEGKYTTTFAKAGSCAGDQAVCECLAETCASAVRSALPDGGPSKCEAARLKAAAKKAAGKLVCNVKALKSKTGPTVDPTCLEKVESKYQLAFAKMTDCSGDQATVETAVDDQCVSALGADATGGGTVGALCPACGGVTTTTTTTIPGCPVSPCGSVGHACSANADCCTNSCDVSDATLPRCAPSPTGGCCQTAGDCSAGACTGGTCTCSAIGSACSDSSDCCSNNCVVVGGAGSCQPSCVPIGSACSNNSDCCSNTCDVFGSCVGGGGTTTTTTLCNAATPGCATTTTTTVVGSTTTTTLCKPADPFCSETTTTTVAPTTTTTLCDPFLGCPTTTTSTTTTTTLALSDKLVFVTSTTHDGNLGGLSGADAICNTRAAAGGLPGTYMAWLSDSTASPSTRFTHSLVPYVLPGNGSVVANDWADLTDGTLAASIINTEFGSPLLGDEGRVWTGTNADGTYAGAFSDCSGWTTVIAASGVYGFATNTLSWSFYGTPDFCSDGTPHLYCFQQ